MTERFRYTIEMEVEAKDMPEGAKMLHEVIKKHLMPCALDTPRFHWFKDYDIISAKAVER